MRSSQRNDASPAVRYVDRVNRAIDVIVTSLDRPLRLEDLSRAAGFSPFHFHRIFQALMGETLGQFVKRLRLERALSLMAHAPRRSLTEIALACGFASSSDFSRSFKQRYDVPPSRFDLAAWRRKNLEGIEATVRSADDGVHLRRLPAGENPDGFEVELRDLPARSVAYIRVLDPYRGTGVVDAAERLIAWAERRGLADGQWLGSMWDHPDVVEMENCRYDIAVEIADPDMQPDGEIGVFRYPPMRVAQIEVRGDIELEMRAFVWYYGTWLPTSGYVPDDQPAFEAFVGRPFAHGFESFELDAQMPVRRDG
ncbi:MAG: GyrI-like domain-containing protein [Planctomycetes bacterium]|nr:GyrI-like domain-containing protein [Planctomycetota bacterium]